MKNSSALDSPLAPENSLSPTAASTSSLRIAWPHVVLGIIGLAISFYAVHLHKIVKSGGSACGISETISCDKVLASYWGAPLGIPLGYFGALFFALVIITAISTVPIDTPRRAIALPRLLLASCGILGSMALTGISIALIHAVCPVCLATHATVLVNFLFALWAYFGPPIRQS